MINTAKITESGNINVPIDIRKILKLKSGDRIVFIEQNGSIIMKNANSLAFEEFQNDMEGEAEKAGIQSEQDVVDLVNDIRRQIWEVQYEGDA